MTEQQTTKRRAKVRGYEIQQSHTPVTVVAAYLPNGYEAIGVGTDDDGEYVLIEGTDFAGWTLDGYVIPRLASGNFAVTEIVHEQPEEPMPGEGERISDSHMANYWQHEAIRLSERLEAAESERDDDEALYGTEITIIASAFGEGKTWTGRVHLDDLADAEPQKQLERIFRRFNRVDEGDVRWLKDKGYNLPSLSMGDVVILHGRAYQAKSIGWEPFTVPPVPIVEKP